MFNHVAKIQQRFPFVNSFCVNKSLMTVKKLQNNVYRYKSMICTYIHIYMHICAYIRPRARATHFSGIGFSGNG